MGTLKNLGKKHGKRRMICPQPPIPVPAEDSESADRYLRTQTIDQHTKVLFFFHENKTYKTFCLTYSYASFERIQLILLSEPTMQRRCVNFRLICLTNMFVFVCYVFVGA